ncbi:acyl-CoA dehydrogenase family protein [Sphingomonas sp. YL-JM2C]
MDIRDTAEQRLLRESARRFAANGYDFHSRQARAASPERFSRTTWTQMAELGWLGLPIAEADGGFGGSACDLAIVMEAIGSALMVEPYLPTMMGTAAIASLGIGDQRAWLAKVATGGAILAFAHQEADGRPTRVRTRALRTEPGWRLNGDKRIVLGGGSADLVLVSARIAGDDDDGSGIGLFLVPADSAGLTRHSYAIADGREAANIDLAGVTLPADALLGGCEDAWPTIEEVMDRGITASAAAMVGAIDTMVRQTHDYVATRVQFGRPIGHFQVVQHRLAEMKVAAEEARAASALAVALLDGDTERRVRGVSAVRVKVAEAARFVTQQAVQLHGGMGLSDELGVSTYLKHALAFGLLFGTADDHVRRYATLIESGAVSLGDSLREPGDGQGIDLTPDETRFRDKVRLFLAEALDPRIRNNAAVDTAALFEYAVSHPWHLRLAEKGWASPGWPRAYGGQDWTPSQEYIWKTESWRAGAPIISQLGMRLVAPTLLHFGTEEQKARFLPRILSGEDYWCQGFSEPGAGSDLAALKCSAVREGDDYVVSGTKLWQTHAHFSDWMLTLVRTSSAGKPQEGITCLLIDMRSPGITVRPIITLGGDHEVNEVFLDGVRVPAANRVGQQDQGWAITKHILSVERGSAGNGPARIRWRLRRVQEIIRARFDEGDPLPGERALMTRLARLAIDTDVVEMLELLALDSTEHGEDPGIRPSITKLRSSLTEQAVDELAVEALGERALIWEPHRPLFELDLPQAELEERAVMPRYLNSRARTVFGGSSEVQLGIIAKAMA